MALDPWHLMAASEDDIWTVQPHASLNPVTKGKPTTSIVRDSPDVLRYIVHAQYKHSYYSCVAYIVLREAPWFVWIYLFIVCQWLIFVNLSKFVRYVQFSILVFKTPAKGAKSNIIWDSLTARKKYNFKFKDLIMWTHFMIKR